VISHFQPHFGQMPRVENVSQIIPHPRIFGEQIHRSVAFGLRRHLGQKISVLLMLSCSDERHRPDGRRPIILVDICAPRYRAQLLQISGCVSSDGIVLRVEGIEEFRLKADSVVNSAGLDAQAVSRSIDGLPTDQIPPRRLARAAIMCSIAPRPFSGLSTRCRNPGGSAFTRRSISTDGHDLDRMWNGSRPLITG
jgi:hypothetical protein